MRRWLLVRRSTDDPEDVGFYQAYGPPETTVERLVGVCQERWAVEECFAEAKGEVVLDASLYEPALHLGPTRPFAHALPSPLV